MKDLFKLFRKAGIEVIFLTRIGCVNTMESMSLKIRILVNSGFRGRHLSNNQALLPEDAAIDAVTLAIMAA